MAKLNEKILGEKYKICTIKDFRTKYAGGVSAQAINYAIENNLVDYLYVGPRVRAIVLTAKSLSYIPNESSKRHRSTMSATTK